MKIAPILRRLFRLNLILEPSFTCVALRFAVALGQILDGFVSLFTLTIVNSGFSLKFAKQLAKARFPVIGKELS